MFPAQAREFLPGIVRNQVERLSPWQADQTVYGFDAEMSREDAAALDVRVFITSRAVLDSTRDELDAMGLPVDRIVAREGGIQAAAPVTLWSRLADAAARKRRAHTSADRRGNRCSCHCERRSEPVGILVGRLDSRRERGPGDPLQDVAAPASGIAHAAGHGVAASGGTCLAR